MTAKSMIRPRPEVQVCSTSGTTMLAFLTKALNPPSLPQLVRLHVEVGSNDKWRANRVCELQNLRHFDLVGCLRIVSCGKVCKYHCQSETPSDAKKMGCPIPTFQRLRPQDHHNRSKYLENFQCGLIIAMVPPLVPPRPVALAGVQIEPYPSTRKRPASSAALAKSKWCSATPMMS